jgi:hypothetical protein
MVVVSVTRPGQPARRQSELAVYPESLGVGTEAIACNVLGNVGHN